MITGKTDGDGGIPHGATLMEFAEAVLGRDETVLDLARRAVIDALGPAALGDTAGIVATFNAIDRVADATGIPLENPQIEATEDMRRDLGIDAFDHIAD